MKNSIKYLYGKLDGHDHWFFENTDSILDMMDDCDVKKEDLPPRLWEAAERGPVLLMQDTNEVIPIPATEEEENQVLRRVLRQRKDWNRIDEHAYNLLDAASEVKRIPMPNGRITILTIHKNATEELIADGLWTGKETRIRITPIGEREEKKSSYTIWYTNGTVEEWHNDLSHYTTIKEERAKTLEAIHIYA